MLLVPPRLPLMRALLLAIILPVFPAAMRAMPQNANKLARLDAVFLFHSRSAAEVTKDHVRFFFDHGLRLEVEDTEHVFG